MASYAPRFDTDVFISYSHRDNKAIDGDGWVNQFRARLENRLSVLLGSDATVWADQRMGPGDVITDELTERLRRSAVLIPIMSPSYLKSNWCERELKEFIQSMRDDSLMIGNKSRIIKVIKLPGDDDHYAEILPDVKDAMFFVRKPEGYAVELTPGSGPFDEALGSLAAAISGILKLIRKRQTVFLGSAPASLAQQRQKMQQELEAYAYRVLSVPSDAGNHDEAVHEAIQESGVSLHFVDSDHARDTDATARQDRPGTAPPETQQVMVVRSASRGDTKLWRDLSASPELSKVEVLVNPDTTTLKNTVMRTLKSAPDKSAAGDDIVRVYLVCHQEDNPLITANRARALRDYLRGLNIEVKLPLAERDEDVDFGADNRAKLKTCDAVILYWGKSGQGWFEQRLMEIKKARGWRKDRPFVVTAGYVADPQSVIKTNFETSEVDLLIKQLESLDTADERLRSFLEKLPAKPA